MNSVIIEFVFEILLSSKINQLIILWIMTKWCLFEYDADMNYYYEQKICKILKLG